jgi:hypothetical protein
MVKSFFITIVALLFSTCLFGQETPEELVKKAWPNAYADFGKDLKSSPLNFIFVLDISDKTFGDDIKNIVKDFLKPVKDGDYFNVILLGSTDKTSNLTECAIVNSSKKNAIIKQIDKQQFGTTGSDGVKMTDLVLNALNCTGAENATPIIFIFSDFVHYNNGYSVPGPQFWQPLITKYDNLKKNIKNPYVYCIELPNVDGKPKYLECIKQIFNELSTVTCSDPSLLDDKFNHIKGQIIKTLLKNVITDKADLQNKNISLLNNGGAIELKKGADSLIYSKLILNEESEKKVAEILNSDKLFSFFPPSDTQIEVSGTLVAEKYKNELPELADDEIKNKKVTLMTADSLIPWWLTDIIVIILLYSIFRFIWTIIPPARLRGSMDFYTPGKSTIVIDCFGNNKKISNNEVSLLKNDFSLEIRATKKFFKGKCLIIYPLNGDLLLDSRKVKKTAPRGKKTIASKRSKWIVDGINITMPNVK